MLFPTEDITSSFTLDTSTSTITLLPSSLGVPRYVLHWIRIDPNFNTDVFPIIDNTSVTIKCGSQEIVQSIGHGQSKDYFLNYECFGAVTVRATSSQPILDKITLTYYQDFNYLGTNKDYYINAEFSYGEAVLTVFGFLIFIGMLYSFLWFSLSRNKIKQ
jgi:hypothetical protein